jgi:hypothetical protein
MVVNRGGLLASTGALALIASSRFASFGRVPEGEQGGGGGAPAAADVEEDFFADAGAATGGDQGGDQGGQGGGDQGGQGEQGDQGGDDRAARAARRELAEWMKSFSAEKKARASSLTRSGLRRSAQRISTTL